MSGENDHSKGIEAYIELRPFVNVEGNHCLYVEWVYVEIRQFVLPEGIIDTFLI